MKKIGFFLTLFISSLLYGQAQYEKVTVNQVDNSLKILSSSDEEITLELTIGGYIKRSVDIDGKAYYSIKLTDESWIKEKGNPELPKITRSIMIPSNSGFIPKIVSEKYVVSGKLQCTKNGK